MTFGIILLFAAVNLLAAFCVVNPWIDTWRDIGILLLILEAVFGIVVGIPVFVYHRKRKNQSVSQSFGDTLRAVLDFITGWL